MPPFFGDNDAQMFRQILRGSYDFDDEVWKPVSGDAKQLITRLMDTDPKKRLTAHQVRLMFQSCLLCRSALRLSSAYMQNLGCIS